jgi:carbon monoxide dehydrogenase subunit G
MEMTGERRIPASRQRVWEALNDPEVLRASIPGCETIEQTGENEMQARVAVKIGPMSARFGGKVRLENLDPPRSYTIVGEGQGGAMGFAKGGADVALEEEAPEATLLRYQVKAQVGGKIAQLGARLIDSTAKHMAGQFFDRFAAQLSPAAAVEGGPAEEGVPAMASPAGPADRTPVRGTDTEFLADRERLKTSPVAHQGVPPVTGPTDARLGGEVSPPPARPEDFRPLRTFTSNPLGLPIQFWIGAAAMVVILLLLFVAG